MAWGRSRKNELPTRADQYPRRPRPMAGLISCICAVFIFLLIAAALAIMITALLLHPRKPSYRLQDVQIRLLNITYGPPPVQDPLDTLSDPLDSRLNSDILVTVQSYNRNHHLKIYNTRLVVTLRYGRVDIGSIDFAPFYQEPKNLAVVQGVMSIRGLPLRHSVAASLNADVTRNGAVDLKSELAARVKFRYGSWKSSWHRWFKVKCNLIVSSPTTPNGSHIAFRKC